MSSPMKLPTNLEVLSLKKQPDHLISRRIRDILLNPIAHDDLISNYTSLKPWDNDEFTQVNALTWEGNLVCFSCIQQRPYYPTDYYRVNSRYYVLPDFRNSNLSRSKTGFAPQGFRFGGILGTWQIFHLQKSGAMGAFMSRIGKNEAFTHFVKHMFNDILPPDLKLQVAAGKYNICGLPSVESCWQHLAGVSFNRSETLTEALKCLPHRGT